MDTVKQAVANAVFDSIQRAIDKDTLLSWPAEIQKVENLQATLFVRPTPNQPRRMFIVQIKETL